MILHEKEVSELIDDLMEILTRTYTTTDEYKIFECIARIHEFMRSLL